MEKILNSLYNYEYFSFYLIISIIILVLLFLIILFFGKKDKKKREIEATKKLQQINAEAFKEDSIEEPLEIEEELFKEENETVIEVPTINSVEQNEEIPEPVLPTEVVVEETIIEEDKVEENNFEPILDRIEEKPLVFDNTNIFKNDFVEEVQEKIENKVEEHEEIEVPEFNLEEIVKEVEEVKNNALSYSKGPQIFSSVYVPEKKEEVIEEKEEIELPKVEIPVEKALEDLEFELPNLKKDIKQVEEEKEEIEIPVLNDYNLDELSGETYTINK